MGKKGKGKKGAPSDGSGDSQTQASGSSSEQSSTKPATPAVEPPKGAGRGRGRGQPQQQIPQVGSPTPSEQAIVPQPQAEAVDPQPGQGGKGKKGKKQEQSVTAEQPQPQVQVPVPAQPADVPQPAPATQPAPGQGKRKGKQKQQQQLQQPETPAPVAAPVQQPGGAPAGRGQTAPSQQQSGPAGRGQTPPPQQPGGARGAGRGQTPPQQQQPSGAPPGRGQTPPQQPGGAWGAGRGQAPPPQQQPSGAPPGRGQTPPQQPVGAWGAGRGQAPPPQQQPSGAPPGRGQTPPQQPGGAWGAGRGQAPPQQQQQQPGGAPPGRGWAPPPQQQQQQPAAWAGRGQPRPGSREQQPAGRGAGQRPPGSAGDPGAATGRVRQVSEASDSSTGSRRRAQQPQSLEGSVQQLHIQQPITPPQAQPRPQEQKQPDRGAKQQQPQAAAPVAPVAKPAAPKSYELAIPRRKNLRSGGTRGQELTVQTNHLALNINPKLECAVHYDVAITPDKPKRMMRSVWEAFRKEHLSKYAFAFDDVRNAYSPTRLYDDVSGEVSVAEDNVSKPKKYTVLMRFAAEVNLRALFSYMASGCVTAVPQEALQCIDIVLRNASALHFVRVGRSYFSEPRGQIVSLGDGLELWHGFFQSAVIGWKPFLNVDVAHKGFPTPQKVIELFAEMTQQREAKELGYEDIDRISKFMRGLKVLYEIPRQPASRRTYRVNKLVQLPADAMFVHDGNKVSVMRYFAEQKNYNIQYGKLPCLWVGPRDRNIFLPPELCTILPGQVFNRKLNETQTANMVRNAATNTDRRKQKIMDSLHAVQFNNDPVVRAFGLQVGADFEKIRARWLAPPDLEYRDPRRPVRPTRGVWRAAEFLQAQQMPPNSWTIVNLDRRTRDDSLHNFVRTLQQSARQLGMDVGAPEQPFPRLERFDARQLEQLLQRHKQKKLVFVVVPDFPTNVYGKVKQAAELMVGCLTQCIKSRTMFKMNPATMGNILLKVNAKLNGHNHKIADNSRPPCLREPCMIMGADVTHPSPDQNDIPSVAAVTASCDPRAFRYNFSWRLQPARQEIIGDLENIVREQLTFFYKQSKQQPKRIIFFRDGVSEGQFQEVMNMEVQAIRRACASMPGTYRPPITFLVVQKRHHTRFFPTKSNESEDKNFNVRAGTVVDTDITHPTDLEYYLVSHASIQGVARPTKYRVLWDDSNMSEDELEALTYYLCHMFSRCTRSVSYPAPTYYAHLAAFRARVYLEGHQINLDNLTQEQARRVIRHEIVHDQPMFFV